MYVADAFGYLASVGVMLFRDFGARELSWLDFFIKASYGLSIGCIVLVALSMVYFRRKLGAAHSSPVLAPEYAKQ
jgi:hypothetical protein